MEGPEYNGNWGGKLSPKEKDLIKGMWFAKSLQALEEICILPLLYEKVENINQDEKNKAQAKIIISI